MTQTAVATRQPNPIATLQRVLADRKDEIAKALPGHITADKFVRTAQTAIAMTRNIEKASPKSLMIACAKAAADGLILDGREAALVVDYTGEAQYRPMMRGLLKLAYECGAVRSISIQTACQNDEFEFLAGDEERITHRVNFRQDRGPVFLVYGIVHLTTGEIIREVMTVAQINKIRDRSDAYRAYKAGKIKSTPWHSDWEEMARKTVFRRLTKYIPIGADRHAFANAVDRIDEEYTFDPPVYDNDPGEIEAPRPAPKKRGAAAAALKDVTPEPPPAKRAKPTPTPEADPPHDPETGEVIEAVDGDEGYDDMIRDDMGPSDDI